MNNYFMKYPRNTAKSEVFTQKKLNYDLNNPNPRKLNEYETQKLLEQTVEIQRRQFNYNMAYAFTMDCIASFCTDYAEAETPRIGYQPSNQYYIIFITKEEYIKHAIGPYASDPDIYKKCWDNFLENCDKPKTLFMFTTNDEGKREVYQGEPIRFLTKRKENNNINKHGGVISNLKNQKTTGGIEYIQIEFFRPMFKSIVEDNEDWIKLPKHLQAILEYSKKKYPQLFQFYYNSLYDPCKKVDITTATARKYFLYVTDHNNYKGNFMNIDAYEFWLSVNSSRIDDSKKHLDEAGRTITDYRLKSWNEARQEVEALAYLHNYLVTKGLLKGIRFTTCGVWYDPPTHNYQIKVYRQEPLTDAPMFIENYVPTAYDSLEEEMDEAIPLEEQLQDYINGLPDYKREYFLKNGELPPY